MTLLPDDDDDEVGSGSSLARPKSESFGVKSSARRMLEDLRSR